MSEEIEEKVKQLPTKSKLVEQLGIRPGKAGLHRLRLCIVRRLNHAKNGLSNPESVTELKKAGVTITELKACIKATMQFSKKTITKSQLKQILSSSSCIGEFVDRMNTIIGMNIGKTKSCSSDSDQVMKQYRAEVKILQRKIELHLQMKKIQEELNSM